MTGPDGQDSATVVVFCRSGVEVARQSVPGHLLEIDVPSSVQLHRRAIDVVHLVESPDPFLECCGRLVLPWVNRNGPGISTMDIPPPAPFAPDDLSPMWLARNRLTAIRRPPTSADADWAQLRYTVGKDVDWQALEHAVLAASGILNSWPTRRVPSVRWLPFDRAGGRLLVGVTERASRGHALPGSSAGVPALTARRATRQQPRALHALAAVTALLAHAIEAVPGIDQAPAIRERLAGLFRRVGQQSLPATPVADPPPSSWPQPLSSTYLACLRALTAVTVTGPGSGSAPLSELWELYQAWCAEGVRAALTAVLGPSSSMQPTSTCIGRWDDGPGVVELHYQPKITVGGAFRALGDRYLAVINDLEPDLLLLRREAAVVRRLVLDPKKRSGGLTSDELSVNASKYLWGIRVAGRPIESPVLEGVVLLAPVGGAGSAHPEGRADTLLAHPSEGIAQTVAIALLDIVRGRTGGLSSLPWRPRWS